MDGYSQTLTNLNKIVSDVDRLTEHYQRGKNLFIQQACYACHRIEGISRGGIGPELTQEGLRYPWFIKESIVWPQADLKSSQMPNQKLDHEELEDLMTYLLAQRGRDPYTSQIERREYVKAWEAGLQQPIEKEINLDHLNDVDSAMMTFAMEGCASCHKLEGYTSSAGYKKPEDRKWFRNLIPEDISGSHLVSVLEEHAKEIDEKIGNVKPVGILEKIEEKDPKLLPAFYAPFKFALRANEGKEWKDRLNLVIKLYYQEYGLGRLIGPRPNWSGIYRSDEWLMEHFWNPQSKAPRSLMPAMPFDDSKFWQLTHMLDVIGKKNRDALQQNWKEKGFKPAEVYQQLCSQCHGPDLRGNGPVAPWIYPIPLNLRNAEFLRNFTKPRLVEIIEHGVKGTPMPPWGESWKEKGDGFETPVLTKGQIEQLATWIFDQLPGNPSSEKGVLKWNYTPESFVEEFNQLSVDQVFDIGKNTNSEIDPNAYLIKQKFYTQDNLQQGKNLFLLNCAMCHGAEADGAGFRAESMQDAKPRILTDVNWINTHDDLWILRAIKYGVPGTSMIGFGDITTPMQRLQIAAYIRSLSKGPRERNLFQQLIYRSYDTSERALLQARSQLPDQEKNIKQIQIDLEKEKLNFIILGNALIGSSEGEALSDLYASFLKSLEGRYVFEGGKLQLKNNPIGSEKVFLQKSEALIDQKIGEIQKQMSVLKQSIHSNEQEEHMDKLKRDIEAWDKLKKNIEALISENEMLWENQTTRIGDATS